MGPLGSVRFRQYFRGLILRLIEFRNMHGDFRLAIISLVLMVVRASRAALLSVEGAPSNSGFNAGRVATVRHA